MAGRVTLELVLDGLGFAEAPRWHDDRLCYSDFVLQEVVSMDAVGERHWKCRSRTVPVGSAGCRTVGYWWSRCISVGGDDGRSLFMMTCPTPPIPGLQPGAGRLWRIAVQVPHAGNP